MNTDIDKIKRYYGENMLHLCKKLFPTILENEGLLFKILSSKFAPNKFLYEDLIKENIIEDFQNYIMGKAIRNNIKKKTNKSVRELLKEVNYKLYEVRTDEELQKFKKYYANGEELCSFYENRTSDHYVFFAVKDNALKLKRKDFTNPLRQDEYGTSVISIQFTKGSNNTISIKNRYNHAVNNPDATYSNNLENIIEGLTDAFEREYCLNIDNAVDEDLDIDGYVEGIDNRYYKYNYEINDIYYCINNTIIDGDKILKFPKEKYIVMDYFILDLVNKKLSLCDKEIEDGFIETISDITDINVIKENDKKVITLKTKDKEDIKIIIDNRNRIISYINNNVLEIKDKFLYLNETLTNIELNNVLTIYNDFLYNNEVLNNISLNSVRDINFRFLYNNEKLETLYLPNVVNIENDFLKYNSDLNKIYVPKLRTIGSNFLQHNQSLLYFEAPNLMEVSSCFMGRNNSLKSFVALNIEYIDSFFLFDNKILENLIIPNIKYIGGSFLYKNKSLTYYELSSEFKRGVRFLESNKTLRDEILSNNKSLNLKL